MAKERLSKLQKWILKKCYQSDRDLDGIKIYAIWRQTIINNYFTGLSRYKNKENATLSRSLRNLRDRGFIKLIGHTGRQHILDIDAFKRDFNPNQTLTEFKESQKDKDPFAITKDMTKWYKKSENMAIIITKEVPNYCKVIELTPEGVKVATELSKS